MIFTRPDRVSKTGACGTKIDEPLYVISPIFNPIRYRNRWKLYKDFAHMVYLSGAKLVTVEIAFGERDFVLEHDIDHDIYVSLRMKDELWIKENAINIGFSRLPSDWKYAAWIDGDVKFVRDDWDNEAIHQLQHYKIIQRWSQSADLSPQYEILRLFRSYSYCVLNNIPRKGAGYYKQGEYYHPGYAWAIRRDAFNQLGGLIDFAILGGADLFQAEILFGHHRLWPKSLGQSGIRWLKIWQERANKYIKKNVGYMDGLILHYWHGKKQNRRYQDRGSILVQANFDPEKDLKRDYQGLWQLNHDNIALRDGIRRYFRERNEDSIDI
ncbi:MAG: hypothetical protein QW303_06270 [Nitrososphaerota archaeon]